MNDRIVRDMVADSRDVVAERVLADSRDRGAGPACEDVLYVVVGTIDRSLDFNNERLTTTATKRTIGRAKGSESKTESARRERGSATHNVRASGMVDDPGVNCRTPTRSNDWAPEA
jgi:hypothetical protein